VTVAGHRTSVRLEPEMWHGIMEISRRERASIHDVCTAIARRKGKTTSLTAAIRVFIMACFRNASSEEDHTKAAHGRGLIAFTASLTQVPPSNTKPTLVVPQSFETTRAF